jgi:1,6-anhydro-N-acetylmuramate kinase
MGKGLDRMVAAIGLMSGTSLDGIDAAVKRFFDLATRSLVGLPLSFPTTTGAAAPTPGGRFEKTYG